MRITDILRKDLKIILGDIKALAIMILMPIILSTILSFALGGSFMDANRGNTKKFSIAVVKSYDINEEIERARESLMTGPLGENLDDEEQDRLMEVARYLNIEEIFFDKFLNKHSIRKFIRYSIEDKERAMELLRDEKISAVVILPENFIYDMTLNLLTPFGNIVDIRVIGSPEDTIGTQMIEGIMTGFADTVSSIIIGKNVLIETAFEEDIGEAVLEEIEGIIAKMTHNVEGLGTDIGYIKVEGKEPISSFQYYAAAMTTMFILFAAGYGSRTLLEERDNKTYERMIVAGTSKWRIAAGKFLMIFVFAFLQVTIMVLYSTLIFKVNWGNLVTVAITTLCTIFSVAGLGTMIAALTLKAGNYKMSSGFNNLIIQIMALIGGSYIPLETLPEFIQRLSILSINGVALKSYLKAMMGYGIGEIRIYLIALLGFGIVFIAIAASILKGKEGVRHA